MQRDVEWVRPRIGQRGTTVEIVIQGMYLSDPQELVFFKPGIRAVRVEPLPKMQHPQGLVHGGRMEEQVVLLTPNTGLSERMGNIFILRSTDYAF